MHGVEALTPVVFELRPLRTRSVSLRYVLRKADRKIPLRGHDGPTVSSHIRPKMLRGGATQGSNAIGSPLSLSCSARAVAQSRSTSAASRVTAFGAARSISPEASAPPASAPTKFTTVAETARLTVPDAGHTTSLLSMGASGGAAVSAWTHESVATSHALPSGLDSSHRTGCDQ